MRIFHRVVTVSLVACAGCNESVPSSPTNSPGLAPPSNARHVISGSLSETVNGVSRPLADRRVNVYVDGTCGRVAVAGECRTERVFAVRTDANGRYAAEDIPSTLVFVAANGPELQPCLSIATVQNDTVIDIEVAPRGTSSPPPSAAGAMITGDVFESTPQGRRPLGGVGAWLEVGFADSYVVASTQTDAAGRFFFCRVNAPVRMVVSGYNDWTQSIPGGRDMSFEIGLER